jgi:hypothetical protein
MRSGAGGSLRGEKLEVRSKRERQSVSKGMAYASDLTSFVLLGLQRGAEDELGAPIHSLSLLTSYLSYLLPPTCLSLLPGDEFRQTALLPRRRVLVNDVFLSGTIEELHRLSIRRLGFGTGSGADLPDSSAQLAPLGAIGDSPGTGLTHAFGGGLDSGHGNLSQWVVTSGAVPDEAGRKHRSPGMQGQAGKRFDLLQETM